MRKGEMEVTAPSSVVITPITMDDETKNNNNKKNKKKTNFTLMKAAISLIRRKPNDKPKSKTPQPRTPSHDVLNTIVGSVRPLHLPDNQSIMSPKRDSSPSSASSIGENSTDYGSTTNLPDLEHRGLSRNRCDSCPNLRDLEDRNNARGGGGLVRKCPLSSFASAMSLLQLGSDSSGESDDDDDDDDEKETKAVENGGDEMIDSKADNFIAQFYSHVKVEG